MFFVPFVAIFSIRAHPCHPWLAEQTPNALDLDGKIPWDYAKENEALKGTDAYWRLNELRF